MSNLPPVEHYIDNIKNFPHPLPSYREIGLEAFNQWGLPHRKHEDWCYTSLTSFLPQEFRHAPLSHKKNSFSPPFTKGIAFCNGHHQIENLPEGIVLSKNNPLIPWKPSQKDSFEALNMATLQSVTTLEISKEQKIEEPLCLFHTITPDGIGKFMSPHIEIVARAKSRITLLEFFDHTEEAIQPYLHNGLIKIQLDEGAHVEHIKVVLESPHALHVGKTRARLASHAHLTATIFSLSGGLVRNNMDIELTDEEAFTDIRGLAAINGKQHHDHFTCVSHNKKHTHSRQLFKNILDDRARGVFTGKIVVGKECPGVDSHLLNKNLLLSPKAHADTRPQLEVYTDDVQCSHGATTGQISPEELFYLKSRGIDQTTAQKILCHAFSEEIIAKNDNPLIRQMITRLLYNNFERHSLEKEQE